jgi:Zn-finger nucleic acid-binding protein
MESESLACPRCGAEMVKRGSGRVSVQQCPDGHGVFLQRIDLGALIDAEQAWHDADGRHTMAIPRITASMTSPPPKPPRAPAWVATLFD